MIEIIVSLIDKLDQHAIMVLIGVGSIMFMSYSRASSIAYLEQSLLITKKYKNEMRNYVRSQLDGIIYTAVDRATEIIKNTPEIECQHVCGLTPLDVQLASYGSRLELVIRTYMADKIHICLIENGFAKLNHEQLTTYIKSTSKNILKETQRRVKYFEHSFPNILECEDLRYTPEEAEHAYRSIVMEYLMLKNLEKDELKELKKSYSLITKTKRWLSYVPK